VQGSISIVRGDITLQEVDAIVNAANNSLLGGGGVDGAIHAAAGPALLAECRGLGGCITGAAKITRGYALPAKWIIHTVGPVWSGGNGREDDLLASCYRTCLHIAFERRLETLAIPSISTGAYRFPVDRAARIAISEIKMFLHTHDRPSDVRLVCFDRQTYSSYLAALSELQGTRGSDTDAPQ
jgi:O-acetyl-ADP-ribose deacetylase (regulator of RNase III)